MFNEAEIAMEGLREKIEALKAPGRAIPYEGRLENLTPGAAYDLAVDDVLALLPEGDDEPTYRVKIYEEDGE